ncbi:TetR-like C-terminal domain-containing protein [Candidatus Soleaferrea massiliensis]|uniref:TetR-like C-terminal domain-containing protein n=1 Tax=Candidatus Soleaferrea massiliensis TaxID=1470354 RepID=UPI001FA6C0F3|nr:TetR-like C-terminal domain-containing protein [Candidatus Soleaferrea massiliensis]
MAFHHAKLATTLLDVITDCVIDESGNMSINSISKYKLYYFSGAFYNMLLCWLESGMKETPEAMADEFLRIANNSGPSHTCG